MIRIDKYLCEMNIGSRSQVKNYLKQGLVTVNGNLVTKADIKITEEKDVVTYKGEAVKYNRYVYYMLHKPAGVVSATNDNTCGTVNELLKNTGYTDIFPVGRLDKDTEGLLLMTNDGMLAHNLLSPKKHVAKTYLVVLKEELSKEDILCLERGVDIGEEKPTREAKVEVIDSKTIRLTITEGKFHQVKRMLRAVGNEVVYLKRLSMGSLKLDESLAVGEYRELTKSEIDALTGIQPGKEYCSTDENT